MKNSHIIAVVAVALVVAAGLFYFVDIDQTQEAALPDVKVSVDGGKLPEFKVETGSIETGTKDVKVMVPKVTMVEETVTVPTVEIEPAKE